MREEIIGDCRLILGDCRDMLPLIASNSVEMIWTDPPYGHSNHVNDLNAQLNNHRNIVGVPILNDSASEMRAVMGVMLTEASRILMKDSCICCCCCGGGGPNPTFAWVADRMDKDGLQFFHSVIWDKKNPGLGWRYRRRHEMVMIAHREDGKLLWDDNDRAVPNIVEYMPPRERSHPNEKPVEMVGDFISWHSSAGHTVLDPFMGSGTTGVACANLGRSFIGIEIDASYFDIACERIEKAYRQPRLFAEPYRKPVQQDLIFA